MVKIKHWKKASFKRYKNVAVLINRIRKVFDNLKKKIK